MSTKFQKKEVEFRNQYPADRQERLIFKYTCPICLRYFNRILISSCCQNYLCRYCIGEMCKKAEKEKAYRIMCMFC